MIDVKVSKSCYGSSGKVRLVCLYGIVVNLLVFLGFLLYEILGRYYEDMTYKILFLFLGVVILGGEGRYIINSESFLMKIYVRNFFKVLEMVISFFLVKKLFFVIYLKRFIDYLLYFRYYVKNWVYSGK